MVASGGVLSEGNGHDGHSVCLDHGQTETALARRRLKEMDVEKRGHRRDAAIGGHVRDVANGSPKKHFWATIVDDV